MTPERQNAVLRAALADIFDAMGGVACDGPSSPEDVWGIAYRALLLCGIDPTDASAVEAAAWGAPGWEEESRAAWRAKVGGP